MSFDERHEPPRDDRDDRDASCGSGAGTGPGSPRPPGPGSSPVAPGGRVPAQREPGEDGGPTPPPGGAVADAELVGRMRAGDDRAYEELYRRHAGAVRRYARTCCRDGHTADDLTAEVFARMLQAVRGGSGPEHAVRPYLLTSVRRVAARWTSSARREQLVDDFALFAARAAHGDEAGPGADVRALHEAEQSMAVRAFRSLPERWQAVLWHTEVEDESPSEVATLFGLDANGTRVLASRAREGLRQAYLQAHVSAGLAADEECARYVGRLGTYARRRLRTRAERGLRAHLAECDRCRLAAMQLEEVASGIPAVVPVAVIGWFGAAGYAKAAAVVAGGAGAGAGAGAAAVAGGGSSSGAGMGAGGAAVVEGLGVSVKAGIAAGVVATATAAAVAIAVLGDRPVPRRPVAGAPVSAPAIAPSPPSLPSPAPVKKQPVSVSGVPPTPAPTAVTSTPRPTPTPTPTPTPSPSPSPTRAPQESAAPAPAPTTGPGPAVTPEPQPEPPEPDPAPTPAPAPAPVVYWWSELSYDVDGDGTGPEMRRAGSSWVWQRHGLWIDGARYERGVTVRGESSVTVDLNRSCSSYDALAGVDDLTVKLGKVHFSVYADEVLLWRSGMVKGNDPPVPVHVDLTGRRTVRLVVEPHSHFDDLAFADWAESKFTCR
jgi:RNA polymerase sigma factor (sigma-70 family)